MCLQYQFQFDVKIGGGVVKRTQHESIFNGPNTPSAIHPLSPHRKNAHVSKRQCTKTLYKNAFPRCQQRRQDESSHIYHQQRIRNVPQHTPGATQSTVISVGAYISHQSPLIVPQK